MAVIVAVVLPLFAIFWMIIVWSHLREQTKYLKKIAEKS